MHDKVDFRATHGPASDAIHAAVHEAYPMKKSAHNLTSADHPKLISSAEGPTTAATPKGPALAEYDPMKHAKCVATAPSQYGSAAEKIAHITHITKCAEDFLTF